jgi:hypothetical protein
MATKAERFKAASERKGLRDSKRKTPRGPGTLKTTADTSKPGVGSHERRWGGDSTGARNRSKHAEQTATYGYEDSNADAARPSRKSTRGASRHHIKHGTQLKSKHLIKHSSPKERSSRRGSV